MVHQRSFSRQSLPTYEPPKSQLPPPPPPPPSNYSTSPNFSKRIRDYFKRVQIRECIVHIRRNYTPRISFPYFSESKLSLRSGCEKFKLHPFHVLLGIIITIWMLLILVHAAGAGKKEKIGYPMVRAHYATRMPKQKARWRGILGGHRKMDLHEDLGGGGVLEVLERVVENVVTRGLEVGMWA